MTDENSLKGTNLVLDGVNTNQFMGDEQHSVTVLLRVFDLHTTLGNLGISTSGCME